MWRDGSWFREELFEFCLDLLTPLTPHEHSYAASGMIGGAGSLS